MKKLSFKYLIMTFVFILYLSFSFLTVFYSNKTLLKNIKNNLKEENKNSADTVKYLLEKEKSTIANDARNTVLATNVFHAFYSNVYLDFKRGKKIIPEKQKIQKMSKYNFITLVSKIATNLSEGSGLSANFLTKHVEMFDVNGKIIAKTSGISADTVDTGNEAFIKKPLSKYYKYRGLDPIGTIDKKNGELFLKGIDRVYQNEPLGVVVISKKINLDFLDSLKRSINKELLLIIDNKVTDTTIMLNKNSNIKINEKNFKSSSSFFDDIIINKVKMGFDFFPLYDFDNNIVGFIGVGFKYSKIEKIYYENFKTQIPLQILFSLLIFLVVYLILNNMFKSFDNVVEITEEIKEGNYNINISTKLRKEFRLIVNRMLSMAEVIEKRETDLKNVSFELKNLNEKLDEEVYRKTSSITSLLNNAGQGFLTFNKELIISSEYSLECKTIFGKEIKNLNFVELLYKNEEDEDSNIAVNKSILKQIFKEDQILKRNVLLSLLPRQKKINKKYINVEYKLLVDDFEEKMMVVLTDVSKNKILEEKMEIERKILKMIVKIVSNNYDFKILIKDYNKFLDEFTEENIIENIENDIYLKELYRTTHTFKGNFSQFYMFNTEENLNNLEKSLSKILKRKTDLDSDLFNKLIGMLNYRNCIVEDFEIIKSFLGKDFISKDEVLSIKENQLIEIENKITDLLCRKDAKLVLEKIRKLRFRTIKELLSGYGEYIMLLAEKLDKSVKKVKCECEKQIYIDPVLYHNFFKSLVHVFRNIVDHGIETPEERFNKNKDKFGKIICKSDLKDNNIILDIMDDGKGIDIDTLKKKLIRNNILSLSELDKLDDKSIIEYIFFEDVSTKEVISNISGRGIGLSAVKEELDKLNGKVEVYTEKDKGTKFKFIIPYKSEKENKKIKREDVLKIFSDYLNKHLLNYAEKVKTNKIINLKNHSIKLNKYTVVLNIKGNYRGRVILSLENRVSNYLSKLFFLEKMEDIKENEKLDLITEMLNTIVGNSTDILYDENEIDISSFYVEEQLIAKDTTLFSYFDNIIGTRFDTEYGNIDLYFQKITD